MPKNPKIETFHTTTVFAAINNKLAKNIIGYFVDFLSLK